VAQVRILKESSKRTVRVETVDGLSRVVKRFHAPGLRRLGDHRRALRERAGLERLAALGLPVPRVVDLSRRGGSWELVLDAIEGAVSLDLLLDGRAPWPIAPGRVGARLGRLLAALVEAGVDHRDLHAGNVLFDSQGRAVLVDAAHLRFGAFPDPRRILVVTAAGVRERDPAGFRARALIAFRAACSRSPGPEATEELEQAARRRRRSVVARRVRRYWRESGALRIVERGPLRGLLRRDLPSELLDDLGRDPPPTGYVALDGSSLEGLRARWERAARCTMHRLASERPVALIHAPRPRAVFQVLGPLRSLADPGCHPDPAELGRALGALHDRALRLRGGAESLAVAPDGAVLIAGGGLGAHDDLADLSPVRSLLDELEIAAPGTFARAFAGALRGTRGEAARILAELEGG